MPSEICGKLQKTKVCYAENWEQTVFVVTQRDYCTFQIYFSHNNRTFSKQPQDFTKRVPSPPRLEVSINKNKPAPWTHFHGSEKLSCFRIPTSPTGSRKCKPQGRALHSLLYYSVFTSLQRSWHWSLDASLN